MQHMEPLVITTLILAFLVIALAIITLLLHRRIKLLCNGEQGTNLEKIIYENHKKINNLETLSKDHSLQLLEIKKDSLSNIQNIGLIRFNPFKEVGGSQSFAVAFTDKQKNGLVLSSLYTRDRVNIFAKPISNGASEYTLTKEELEALRKSNL